MAKSVHFCTRMILALQKGRKSEFRRISTSKSHFEAGDVLGIKETFTIVDGKCVYKADVRDFKNYKWHPAIFMPEKYIRYHIRVKKVWEENYFDMNNLSRQNEGIDDTSFQSLWGELNSHKKFDGSNPIVRVVRFERV